MTIVLLILLIFGLPIWGPFVLMIIAQFIYGDEIEPTELDHILDELEDNE